jgi:hypothetical protein
MQTPIDPLQYVSSRHYAAESWSVELSIRDAREEVASRHDEQVITARAVPVDPYAAWLQERESDRNSSAVPV